MILIAAIFALLLQYILDFFDLKTDNKRVIGAVILCIAIAMLIINNASQNKTNEHLTSQLRSLDSTHSALQTKFDINKRTLDKIRIQNDSLLNKIDPFILIAKTKYPKLSNEQALQKLKDEFTTLSNNFTIEKNKIKQFSAELKINFKTFNSYDPSSDQILSGYENEYHFVLRNRNNSNVKSEFWCIEPYRFTRTNRGFQFKSRLKVKDGASPIGHNISFLDNYNIIDIHIPFINTNSQESTTIFIQDIETTIYINGIEKIIFFQKVDNLTKLHKFDSIKWASFSIPINYKNGISHYFQKY